MMFTCARDLCRHIFIHLESDDWHNRIGDIVLLPHWPKLFNVYSRKA